MRALAISITLLAAIVSTGCKPEIPDATFACKKDANCPSGQFCHASDGLCHRQRETARDVDDAGMHTGGAGGSGMDSGPRKDSGAAMPEDAAVDAGGMGTPDTGMDGGPVPDSGDSGGSAGDAAPGPCVLGTSSIGDCVLQ